MTRIAIFSDIHGNVPALEAVLDDLAGQEVDEVLVGGDLVGRGPQGTAVVRRISGLGLRTIGGNHEDYLLSFRRGEVPEGWLTAGEWAASRWMARELEEDAVRFIRDLPFSLVPESAPELRLVHGTPRSNREGIGPWSREHEIEEHWSRVEEEVLVCAHTHRPLVHNLGHQSRRGGLVVNVGSVGLPFNRDRRAQYAILQREGSSSEGPGWRVEHRRVPYDLEAVFRVYEDSGFLAEGGVTARLLRMELEHASPLLVPFLQWAEVTGREPSEEGIEEFLAFHRPGEPLGDFFQRLATWV